MELRVMKESYQLLPLPSATLCVFVKNFSVLDKCNVTWGLTAGSME